MDAARTDSEPTVTLADIEAAARAIEGAVERTPSSLSRTMSQVLGAQVVVKFENLQFVAAFKERGALNRLLQLSDEQRRLGVVAMSQGNHAQAVAFHAARLGVDALIVMPEGTPFVKVQRTQVLGARVVQHGDSLEAAGAEARRIASDEGRTLIHPYDDPAVVAGQGTVALELLADHPDIDTMVVPVGGGGLLAGIAIASRALAPDVRLFGAQSERYPSMVNEIKGRHDPVGGTSIADGIAVPKAGALTSRIIGELVDDVLTVSEEHIEEAMNLLLEIEKIVVEGAGAVGIAALIEHRSLFEGHRVGVVLSGGNVDPRLLASVIMRGLVRNGRLSRLQIEVKDAPGALGKVTTVLGEAGANIVEISHQRMFVDVSARSAELEVVVETLDHDHLERVAEALREAGFEVRIGTFTFGP